MFFNEGSDYENGNKPDYEEREVEGSIHCVCHGCGGFKEACYLLIQKDNIT